MTDHLTELEAAARAATETFARGPWWTESELRDDSCHGPTDARYIALASPERVLALIAVARAAEGFSGATHHPDCPVSRWTPESRTLRVCHCGYEALRDALAALKETP